METRNSEQPNITGNNRKPNGQFAPGHVANPKGRPKGSLSLVTLLRQKLETLPKDQKKSFADGVIDALVKKAITEQDMTAIKEIFNRIEGMPEQAIRHYGDEDEAPMRIILDRPVIHHETRD